MMSVLLVLVVVGLTGALLLLPAFGVWRVDRRYREADIRLVGGPFDGVQAEPFHGGFQWPPPNTFFCYRVAESEGERQWYKSTYRGAGHEYRFKEEIAVSNVDRIFAMGTPGP